MPCRVDGGLRWAGEIAVDHSQTVDLTFGLDGPGFGQCLEVSVSSCIGN